MKILVTGGAGFIGSYLSTQLLENGNSLIVLDDLSTGKAENIDHLKTKSNFSFCEGSILDQKLIFELLEEVDG